ncbi:type II secretion system protein [Geotalea uraniireducens]|uniref:Type II secretion system protein n=1 Tax=Geotalea uraniireducens TaxID=351604 RepID=A0ABM8EM96_9BACT|nr:secretin N-terminal domain-containing protein [Geotalea uraniireducens]BDV43353.1 type II secretion system protein [Geotalea uraniireducens]
MRIILKVLAVALLVGGLAGCGAGLTAFNKGEKLETDGKFDEAVLKYAEATAANPTNYEYRLRLLKVSEKAARLHLNKGEEYFNKHQYDDALREYQEAVALDNSLDRARQQSEKLLKIRNAQTYFKEAQEFEKGNKLREALQSYRKGLAIDPDNNEAKDALERLLQTRKTRLEGYELNLKSTKPITLKFKDAKIKDVFYILTQLSGINFIFDDAVKDQNVTIFLENATFQQALEILTGMNKLGKKVLNESTIIIFPKTPEKTKQYEDLIVKTFYLNTLDAKKAVNLLRTMLQVRKIYVNEDLNAIVIRDTPDVIDVAQKIIEANDVPDAEVVLDLEVIEVSKNNAENFGLGLSSYSLTMNARTPGGEFFSDTFSPTTTTTSSGTTTTTTQVTANNLLNVFNWSGYNGFVTVPSATYNFSKRVAHAEVLANPKIRVKNREKAKFTVGTRVPITTTSTTGTTGGFSVNVQYVDVGVKLNAEPTIQIDNDVSIKLSLEVSSIISKETVGGTDSATTVVTIGTRNLDTVLNLKDGETSLIGGLIQDNKSKSNQKIFLLGDIPLLGPLFSNNVGTDDKNELVLAVTPRIVRAVTIPDSDVASFWSGKEDEPSTAKPYSSFVEEPEFPAVPPAVPAKPAPVTGAIPHPASSGSVPAIPAPAAGNPATPGVTPPAAVSQAPAAKLSPAAVAAGATVPPAATNTAAAARTTVPVAAVAAVPSIQAPLRGSLNITAPSAVNSGSQFKVDIKASDVKGLARATFVLLYDPIFVEYVGATEGNFLNRDGKPTTFTAQADKGTGRVTVTMARTAVSEGAIDGTGTLLTATFLAKNKGPASLGLQNVKFVNQASRPIEIIPYNTVVEVK